MVTVFARKALLAEGWAKDVRITVRAGRIAEIASGVARAAADECVDIVIPGICNAHSHAFQRALTGKTEQRSPGGEDNFWSWRTRMYELANRLDAGQLAAIATQAYTEMLAAGYTAVAEFHYLHCDPATDSDAMFAALQIAAANSGIRLIYVPVLYERAGFDASEPLQHQRRFVMSLDAFLEHHERCIGAAAEQTTVAIGAHSLRAVSAASLQAIARRAHEQRIPVHLHIAEQQAEIEQCVGATGKRPVEWLLENVALDENWCLVHATHMNDDEITALAKSNAVVCLCPTTEANLGDGIFPLHSFLAHGGRIAIGSDSQASINPFEELRWLEYGQRLTLKQRNLLAGEAEPRSVGAFLFKRALAGGAQALARPIGRLAPGARADLIVIDDTRPALYGRSGDLLLDALVFAGNENPVTDVMVGGTWAVRAARHPREDAIFSAYKAAVRDLMA